MNNNKLKQISTKKGDSGTAKNYSNEKYSKDHIVFEVLGTIDELSSFLGLSYHLCKLEMIKTIQKHLQRISSQVATNSNSSNYKNLEIISDKEVSFLEKHIESNLESKPLKNTFYLPGSEKSIAGAYLDISRAITRRCERRIITFNKSEKRQDLNIIKMYLNRLSDLLFVLANIS